MSPNPRPFGFQPAHCYLPKPVFGQATQLLRCRHIQGHLEVLFRPARCRPAPCRRRLGRTQCAGPWYPPYRSGAGSRVESPQAAALFAEDSAQILGGLRDSWDPRPGLAWRAPWCAAGRRPAGRRAPGVRRSASGRGVSWLRST